MSKICTGLSFLLLLTGSLGARAEKLTGQIVDAQNQAVAGISVTLESQQDLGTGRGMTGYTTAEGEIHFYQLKPGTYQLSVGHPEILTKMIHIQRGQETVLKKMVITR